MVEVYIEAILVLKSQKNTQINMLTYIENGLSNIIEISIYYYDARNKIYYLNKKLKIFVSCMYFIL